MMLKWWRISYTFFCLSVLLFLSRVFFSRTNILLVFVTMSPLESRSNCWASSTPKNLTQTKLSGKGKKEIPTNSREVRNTQRDSKPLYQKTSIPTIYFLNLKNCLFYRFKISFHKKILKLNTFFSKRLTSFYKFNWKISIFMMYKDNHKPYYVVKVFYYVFLHLKIRQCLNGNRP